VRGVFERPSTIRRYDSIADPKYEGVKITRKSLMVEDDEVLSEEDEDAQSQSGSDEEDEEEDSESNANYDDDEVPPSQGEENEDDEEETKSVSGTQLTEKPSAKPEELAETVEVLSATLRQKREEDRRKGRSVLRQIVNLFPFGMFIYIIHTNL
jgi:protein AATF/BFR2